MKILIIDNYDSFTYNLVHLVKQCGNFKIEVIRNDRFTINDVQEFDKIIISPGPGIPDDAGLTKEVIKKYCQTKSILGICLGHQAIVESFGGRLLNLAEVLHGVSSINNVLEVDYLYQEIPKQFDIAHYHSWVADDKYFPSELIITSRCERGNIMSVAHKEYDVRGLQFHPESILTQYGKQIITNWLIGKK